MTVAAPGVEYVEAQHSRHELVQDRQVDVLVSAQLVGGRAVARLHHLMVLGLEMTAEEQSDRGGVVGDQDAGHCPAFWHHSDMEGMLFRLPPHERKRLLALSGVDPEELARRRLDGEPLQYLEGSAAFADFDVTVDRRVLVPRPETEGLYELATRLVDQPTLIVDLGTGSGVLAIALARTFAAAEVHAVDSSGAALELARDNARRLGVGVTFHHGDLFHPLPSELAGRVDLVVSNPPYVAEREWAGLPADVQREPREALVAGPRGTEVLERIAAAAGDWLAPGGWVACEMGETQAEAVQRAFSVMGSAEVRSDLSGRPRYVVARSGR